MLSLLREPLPAHLSFAADFAFVCGAGHKGLLGSERTYRLTPTGCVDIVYRASAQGDAAVLVATAAMRPRLIAMPPNVWYAGIRLKVYGLPMFFDYSPAQVLGERRELAALSKRSADWLATFDDASSPHRALASLYAMLSELAAERKREAPRPGLAMALERCANGSVSEIGDLCSSAGLAERSFRRYCIEWTGWSPKRLHRIGRCSQAVHLIQHTDLSLIQIAFQTGFSDQAHLTRECQLLHGQTPGELRRESQSAEF